MWTYIQFVLMLLFALSYQTDATITDWSVPNITGSANGSGEIYVRENQTTWFTFEDINAISDTGAVHLLYTYVTQILPIVVLTDGGLYINASLDFETTQSYTIVVTKTCSLTPLSSFNFSAEDNAMPVGSGTATVTIIVTDVNEYSPQFGASVSSICINDGSEENTVLTTVLATDQDTANTVTHGIAGGNTHFDFKIDVNTGEIQVNVAHLNASITTSYDLVVEATDDGSPMLTGTTTIPVTVGGCSSAPRGEVSWMATSMFMAISVLKFLYYNACHYTF